MFAPRITLPLTNNARIKIEPGADPKADHDVQRPRRIGLRGSKARGCRGTGSTRCQMQEPTPRKFHGCPLTISKLSHFTLLKKGPRLDV